MAGEGDDVIWVWLWQLRYSVKSKRKFGWWILIPTTIYGKDIRSWLCICRKFCLPIRLSNFCLLCWLSLYVDAYSITNTAHCIFWSTSASVSHYNYCWGLYVDNTLLSALWRPRRVLLNLIFWGFGLEDLAYTVKNVQSCYNDDEGKFQDKMVILICLWICLHCHYSMIV